MASFSTYTVRVCNGSGCLFQVDDPNFTYVLTARHVLQQDISISREFIDEHGDLKKYDLQVIEGPFLHENPAIDAAILKVRRIDNLGSLSRIEVASDIEERFEICGYPSSRAAQSYGFRTNKLQVVESKPLGYIEAELDQTLTYREVRGMSGGPLLRIESDQIYIGGIQQQMAAKDDDEMLGRIEFMPLRFFDEIIEQHGIRPIISEHLYCFSKLKQFALPLKGCIVEDNVEFTRVFLKELTKDLIDNGLTPKYIRDFFQMRLLAHNSSSTTLEQPTLWVAWLEYLIILNILRENKISIEDLESIFNDFRLIYCETKEDWTSELANIVQSDYKGMPLNAKIIIATPSVPVKYVIEPGYIGNIVRAQKIPRGQMQIDEGFQHPLMDYRLIHLYAFQKNGIIDKEHDYSIFTALNEDQLFQKLKEEFNAILG